MEKIVDYFLHGMMDEVQTGKSFEFSDAEKTQFVQDINLFYGKTAVLWPIP
ncbi:MAG: hypothetical protein ACLU99_12920 [Alphaproteobacteria bacterium]